MTKYLRFLKYFYLQVTIYYLSSCQVSEILVGRQNANNLFIITIEMCSQLLIFYLIYFYLRK